MAVHRTFPIESVFTIKIYFTRLQARDLDAVESCRVEVEIDLPQIRPRLQNQFRRQILSRMMLNFCVSFFEFFYRKHTFNQPIIANPNQAFSSIT